MRYKEGMKEAKSGYKNFRPVALSLAGFDPSGGAGVLADIKTFEQHKVYGLAVNTCITIQNDLSFHSVDWQDSHDITSALTMLAKRYTVAAVKLGMHKDIEEVLFHVQLLKKIWPQVQIVWDPVMATTSGHDLKISVERKLLEKILSKISLVTPNLAELEKLRIESGGNLSNKCAYLVKGGHSSGKFSEDLLFENGKLVKIYTAKRVANGEKHGSGCVLSSAITANLAKGNNLRLAISNGKKYVTKFLSSNETLSGYHN